MIVYGEYLFLENCLAGWIALHFTARMAGLPVRPWRQAVCAALCGGIAFTLFAPLPPPVSLLLRPLFALVIAVVAFGLRPWRRAVALAALYLLVTVFYGGTALAVLDLCAWPGLAGPGGVYLPRVTYVTVTAAAAAGLLALTAAVRLLRLRRRQLRAQTRVRVGMGGRQWELDGWIDSGNFLREPLTGRPVALVGKTLMEEMLEGLADRDARYTVVPYRAVGTADGLLDGWRADFAELSGQRIRQPVLAVWSDAAHWAGTSGAQILLPASLLESEDDERVD